MRWRAHGHATRSTRTRKTEMSTEPFSTETLDELAAAINRSHHLAYGYLVDGLEQVIECGSRLIEARARVPRGKWADWVAENIELALPTVRTYMRIATYRDKVLSAENRPKSVEQAIKYLRAIEAPPMDGASPPKQRRKPRQPRKPQVINLGVVAEAQALLRQSALALQRAMTEAYSDPMRTALMQAITHVRHAETLIANTFNLERPISAERRTAVEDVIARALER